MPSVVPEREGQKPGGDDVFVAGGTVLSHISEALVSGSETTVRGLSAGRRGYFSFLLCTSS